MLFFQPLYKVFKEKTKPIITENISATAFINSLLPTSHFFSYATFLNEFTSHNLHNLHQCTRQ